MLGRTLLRVVFLSIGLWTCANLGNAATVTFEGGTLVGNVYTENGLQFALYGDAHLTPFSGGTALTIGTAADVIIAPVGGGQFSLDNFLTLGPNYTVLLGWVNAGDLHSGGNNNHGTAGPLADVGIDMSAINPTTIFPTTYDPRWGHIGILDFCGYCITSFGAAGGIDNINFSIPSAVPELSTWALMILGFAGLGFIALRQKPKSALMAT